MQTDGRTEMKFFFIVWNFFSGSFEIQLISFLVVLAAMTKSAQIPVFFLITCGYSCSYTFRGFAKATKKTSKFYPQSVFMNFT